MAVVTDNRKMTCSTRDLQLAIKNGLNYDKIQQLIELSSNIVGYFKHSNVATQCLKAQQEQLGLKTECVIQSCKTRQNSEFMMFNQGCIPHQPAIDVLKLIVKLWLWKIEVKLRIKEKNLIILLNIYNCNQISYIHQYYIRINIVNIVPQRKKSDLCAGLRPPPPKRTKAVISHPLSHDHAFCATEKGSRGAGPMSNPTNSVQDIQRTYRTRGSSCNRKVSALPVLGREQRDHFLGSTGRDEIRVPRRRQTPRNSSFQHNA